MIVCMKYTLAAMLMIAFTFPAHGAYQFIDQGGGALVDGPGGVAAFGANVTSVSGTISIPLYVELDLAHSWAGDLTVTLEHEGVSVTLLDRLGAPEGINGNGADFDGVYRFETGASSWAVHDVAQAGVGETIGGGTFDVNNTDGSSLDDFLGTDFFGEWTLTINDAVMFDSGALRHWRVGIIPAPSSGVLLGVSTLAALGRRRHKHERETVVFAR